MAAGPRASLLLVAAALAAGTAALLLALGLPLLARRALDAPRYALLAVTVAAAVLLAAAALLRRVVGRPVERLLAAAARLGGGRPGELPPLGEGAASLAGAAVAFERVAGALAAERAALAAKVAELTAANRALADAERLAAVGRLAAGLAHEIGNPLGAVTGYAALARARPAAAADPALADALDRIGAAADRIDRTIRDLLDLARPAALAPVPLALGGPLEAAVRLARIQPRCRELEVALLLPPDLPPVLGAEQPLVQLFLNLLLNAGDATGGRGRVEVRARREGDRVEVELRDGGPGIPPADLPRLFEPFFTTKPRGQGSGLGLAVCRGIAAALGGELTAASPPGGGAAFTLRLRAAPATVAPWPSAAS